MHFGSDERIAVRAANKSLGSALRCDLASQSDLREVARASGRHSLRLPDELQRRDPAAGRLSERLSVGLCRAVERRDLLLGVQVGIALFHGDLNGVMEVGDGVVAPQEQPTPDHRTDAAQNHLELVNA